MSWFRKLAATIRPTPLDTALDDESASTWSNASTT